MWMEQLEIQAKRLNVIQYHGSNRKKTANHFATSHITVTTYGDVRSEYKDYRVVKLAFQAQANHEGGIGSMPQLRPAKSRILPLMTTSWYRVVLEKANVLRKDDQALTGSQRWASSSCSLGPQTLIHGWKQKRDIFCVFTKSKQFLAILCHHLEVCYHIPGAEYTW